MLNPSEESFDVMYSTIPLTGDVIAESRADVLANGVTTWSRTSLFAHEDVMVVPGVTVL